MRRRIVFSVFCILVLSILLSSELFAQDESDIAAVSQGNTQLAVELYRRFGAEKESFFFSPYSIYTALAMLYGGARGETADQIGTALNVSLEDEAFHSTLARIQAGLNARQESGGVELGVANALWLQEGIPFLPDYVELVESYQAELSAVDYVTNAEGVWRRINAWAEERTKNRIREVLPDPPFPSTLLILANAIYFNGNWASQFDESCTTAMPFHGANDETTQVSMMRQTYEFGYRQDDLMQVLEMPYVGDEFSMVILLPDRAAGIEGVEALLTADGLEEWTARLHTGLIDVYIPKFEMTSDFKVGTVLQAMGVTDAFQMDKADFTGIDGVPNRLYLDGVIHKAFVDVDEEGTEAAAVTISGCFPAGTQVLTAHGQRSIEEVDAGTSVFSFDWSSGEWVLARVQSRQSILYEGEMVAIDAGSITVNATGNHPFYVLRGENLGSRPEPLDVPEEERQTTAEGRWVEARDLRAGDVLMSKGGDGVTITGLSSRHRSLEVYNLAVDAHHNYAIDQAGILVHNKGAPEPMPVEFLADHPFLFLIRDVATGGILFMGRVGTLPGE